MQSLSHLAKCVCRERMHPIHRRTGHSRYAALLLSRLNLFLKSRATSTCAGEQSQRQSATGYLPQAYILQELTLDGLFTHATPLQLHTVMSSMQ